VALPAASSWSILLSPHDEGEDPKDFEHVGSGGAKAAKSGAKCRAERNEGLALPLL